MMSAGFILSEEDGDTFLRHYGGHGVDENDKLQQQQQLYDLQLTYTLFRTQQVHSIVFQSS